MVLTKKWEKIIKNNKIKDKKMYKRRLTNFSLIKIKTILRNKIRSHRACL